MTAARSRDRERIDRGRHARRDAVITNIVGEQATLENMVLAEANLLSRGIVLRER